MRATTDWGFARRTRVDVGEGLASILALSGATDLISFAGGFPDPETFPAAELAGLFERVAQDPAALQYAPTPGLPGPRGFMADRLEAREGLRPADEELLITSGGIEALELLGKSLIDPGDLVLVEGPTYLGAIMAFRSFEADVVAVPMDDDGLDVGRLEETVLERGRPKLLYTIPDHQNPAGVSLAEERRGALVEVARRHGFLVVEDVAYRELGFEDARPPSLWSLGPDVVVQVGTFSKTFFPGVRLGWAAGPVEVVTQMVNAKQNTDQCAGALGQRLLEEYGRAGGLEAQAERARELYGRRCRLMLEALEAHLPEGIRWTRPRGGFFTWLTYLEGVDTAALAKEAMERKVAFVPGKPFFPDGTGANTLRLSFSRVRDEEIDEGIRRLAEVSAEGGTG
ncbi:MAG TPA: PLP-dependent aminotransferase family protein [Actinomycetota bacterium]